MSKSMTTNTTVALENKEEVSAPILTPAHPLATPLLLEVHEKTCTEVNDTHSNEKDIL